MGHIIGCCCDRIYTCGYCGESAVPDIWRATFSSVENCLLCTGYFSDADYSQKWLEVPSVALSGAFDLHFREGGAGSTCTWNTTVPCTGSWGRWDPSSSRCGVPGDSEPDTIFEITGLKIELTLASIPQDIIRLEANYLPLSAYHFSNQNLIVEEDDICVDTAVFSNDKTQCPAYQWAGWSTGIDGAASCVPMVL